MFLNLRANLQVMDPVLKKSKKKARNTGGETQPARQTEVNYPTGKYSSSRDEKELVDYEPEEPAAFSPVEDDISVQECYTPAVSSRLLHAPVAHLDSCT
jgi:hypothetical protein